VRPPFLDHRVVEFCSSLPTNLKLRGFTSKWLLKSGMEKRLPPGIATRKKQGFSIPMKNWIRGELLQLTRDEIFSSPLVAQYFNKDALERRWREHQQQRHNHSHLFWGLLNLSLWDRRLLSGPRPGTAHLPSSRPRGDPGPPARTVAA
jgi:asparagine synthase (glutamine-hydrolysing)